MSRRVFDTIVEKRKFDNIEVYTAAETNPRYHGVVERKFYPIKLETPNNSTEQVRLIDLLLTGTNFPQEGENFQFIGDRTYNLTKEQFKQIKLLAISQLQPIEDVSKGIADAVLWFNGNQQGGTGSKLYEHVFNEVKNKIIEILNQEERSAFQDAIDSMHGE